eukprot:TRINITY_DN6033_c0_g1_i2.p1 TRINITY_DN6033_c0_g1~~TRINITY_DN6033_c0_g1_i2.p1  ORF type:complete len:505 (-),score=137.21 TRINITY_DN6033_c0_g1_i2:431-1945(-)
MGVGYQFGQGFFWGSVATISAPLGAMLGLKVDPSNRTKTFMIAFGAGALLFALTVELFAKALHDIDDNNDSKGKRNAYLMIVFAVLGAYFFRWVNRKLNQPESLKQAMKDIQEFFPKMLLKLQLLLTCRFREIFYDQIVQYEDGEDSKQIPVIPSIIIEDTTPKESRPKSGSYIGSDIYDVDSLILSRSAPESTLADVASDEPLKPSSQPPKSWMRNTSTQPSSLTEQTRLVMSPSRKYTTDSDSYVVASFDPATMQDKKADKGKPASDQQSKDAKDSDDSDDDSDSDIFQKKGTQPTSKPKQHEENKQDLVEKGRSRLSSSSGSSTDVEDEDFDVYQPPHTTSHDKANVGLAIWLGLMIDGIPESVIIGVMTQEDSGMSVSFILGVLMSNFPEAMSSATLMLREGHSTTKILALWWGLFLFVGISAGISAAVIPSDLPGAWSPVMYSIEGVAAGAMLTVIAQTMIPEAFEMGGDLAGPATLFGFLAAMFSFVLFDAGKDNEEE